MSSVVTLDQLVQSIPSKHNIKQKVVLLFLFIIFICLLIYGFPDSPVPWFDEGLNLGIAKSWVEHGVFSLAIGPQEFVTERSLLITTNYPLLFFIAASFKIFGIGLWQAKIVMLLFLAVFVFLFYQLARKYYGNNCALISLALLIVFLPLYGDGKSSLGEIPGLTYALASLLLLTYRQNPRRLFFSGVLMGLAASTKPIYILLLISFVLVEFIFALKNKVIDRQRWLFLGFGFVPPLLLWLYTMLPDKFSTDYLIKTFLLYSNPYNVGSTLVLPNLYRFISESTPLHFLLFFLVFLLSKLFVKPRALKRGELFILLFVCFDIIFYLKTAGWYRYFFPAHVLLFLVFPPALFALFNYFWPLKNKILVPLIILGLLWLAQVANLYSNIGDSFYRNPAPRLFAEETKTIIKPNQNILVVDAPEIAFLIDREPTFQYIHTNPHTAIGRDLLATGYLPGYIISGPWEENNYLKNFLNLSRNYTVVLTGGHYNLYMLNRNFINL